jgi:ferredoxin-NADP reductase
VQVVPEGEVSSYLCEDASSGDTVEVRGPVGGWFVWSPGDGGPVLLVGGGSGVVPLMAMVRTRDGASPTPFRLIYSVRTPEGRIYDHELRRRATQDRELDITFLYTRTAPSGETRPAGRITAKDLLTYGWSADVEPSCYVCGPTPFVETVADLLIDLGHNPTRIRTERFGPTGP